ncbi:hypothetical protein HMPREF3192_00079 [Atopobium deltae]|uniref:Uncharacterized protein n=1 Tax=Atopobium deltae TaxID=1393034 RepID=A0A133XXN9_9ACTN|nr:hypothetical protein HMPREF3192_00079 [Atopobium deltae]
MLHFSHTFIIGNSKGNKTKMNKTKNNFAILGLETTAHFEILARK